MKIRLDKLLIQKNLAKDIKHAQKLIMAGLVITENQKLDKAGLLIDEKTFIKIKTSSSIYVSRGAEKLKGAHKKFNFTIKDNIALDIGQSTGGFTDYLLQNGIKHIFGIDVGYGHLALKLRNHPQVDFLEKTNARYLTKKFLQEKFHNHPNLEHINLVVMDLSFISITKVLPAIKNIVSFTTDYIILIKPQFEAKKYQIERGGIIKNSKTRLQILEQTKQKLSHQNFQIIKECESPIKGTKGNTEYFFWLKALF